jgi:hypothetical protein
VPSPKAFAPRTVTVVWGDGAARVYVETRELSMVESVEVDAGGEPKVTFRSPRSESEGLILDEETRHLRSSGLASIRRSR